MKIKLIYFSVLLILLTSCGTSLIKVTGNTRPYAVYINKQFKGMTNSDIKIPRCGLPQKKLVEIKDTKGNIITREKISRDINGLRFIIGLVAFYPIWFFSWEYDKKIEIYIDNSNNNNSNTNQWDKEKAKSPWD
jgi:hypothetical protein